MRIANVENRLMLLTHGPGQSNTDYAGIDVELASEGRFGSEPQAVYERWDEFTAWCAAAGDELRSGRVSTFSADQLRPVTPRPPQIFAVGLNYRDHAEEADMALPDEPLVFTKYASALTGPTGDIPLSPGNVDWEVELVAVVSRGGRNITQTSGWDHVAGLTIGQDISDRITQFMAPPPQFGLGKSHEGFAPIGPALVTPDELADRDDLEIGCAVNGEPVQKSRTSQMVFTIPQLVEKLSAIIELLPGDLIFTGTPGGVGVGMSPPRFLHDGDVLTTWCEAIGEMSHRFVAPNPTTAAS